MNERNTKHLMNPFIKVAFVSFLAVLGFELRSSHLARQALYHLSPQNALGTLNDILMLILLRVTNRI
jgi:hypothetical protein